MKIKVYPYKQGSKSARALADALGGRVLKRVGSKYRYREGDLVINWGASNCPYTGKDVANQPDAVATAANKLTALEMMHQVGVSVPKFWDNDRFVENPETQYPIMCRTKLTGHSGEGIVIANNADEVVNAPLYTQYIKKQDEYRVHVGRKRDGTTSIISLQRKAKRRDAEDVNYMIRNLANGFVYVRDGVDPPECVVDEAVKAVEALGLAFGGVDVIYNANRAKAYVLEVNTACGLEGQTLVQYANFFKEINQ